MTELTSSRAATDQRLMHLSAALLVEREVRGKRNIADLGYYLVNETARVHEHHLAFLLRPKGRSWRVSAVSDVTKFEETSPLGDALRRFTKLQTFDDGVRLVNTSTLSLPDSLALSLPAHVMLMPLIHPDGGVAGLLILLRDHPWPERDRMLAEPLAECYGHALVALEDRPWFRGPKRNATRLAMGVIASLAIGSGFIQVPLTALAPAEIISAQTLPVTAPFDGIVSDILVQPYTMASPGQELVRLDATELTMDRDIARKALAVTEAELRRIRREAILDPNSKAKLAVWAKKVELRQQTLANADDKLVRHKVISTGSGVVLYDDRFNWKGRPVKAGQRFMTLAAPDKLELQIDLPAANLIPLKTGAKVTLFLDMDPARPLTAELTRIGYQARSDSAGVMAYRYQAKLDENQSGSVLGARGTARLEGKSISLAYALFRRPLTALRQFLGL
jgi:multidrug resistance efflux pump